MTQQVYKAVHRHFLNSNDPGKFLALNVAEAVPRRPKAISVQECYRKKTFVILAQESKFVLRRDVPSKIFLKFLRKENACIRI